MLPVQVHYQQKAKIKGNNELNGILYSFFMNNLLMIILILYFDIEKNDKY